ncbi:ferredoxin-fold anticodon-binding domain-containing protein 1 isoform X2 [Osmerus eperlanus]|uniref:ferredoxin-fold anticodon-binding domain-containing protein 1 isoform X2 n=1 Tax=Osmerus eperlanus TaxID=29151 RepID=UPI002E0FDA3E
MGRLERMHTSYCTLFSVHDTLFGSFIITGMSGRVSVLLVGEGNFSFAAGLAQEQLSMGGRAITATCLQCQREALRHEGTAINIQTIKDSGGEVLFEVDSTRLGDCEPLGGRIFDLVVFNFPHCGRKSGVKKNRELLKNFFLSCVQVLREEGEVHIALCNGQGGTPADQPMREWHNSWQVIVMAAEAGLLLSDVRPFDDKKFASYRCTGYRSQDKGFHVTKALTHVFTRGLPLGTPQKLRMLETVGEERVHYHVPAELKDYIHRDFLSPGSVHPVRVTQDILLNRLTEEWSISMVTEPLPHVIRFTPECLQACGLKTDSRHCYWVQPFHTAASFRAEKKTDQSTNQLADRPTPSDDEGNTEAVVEALEGTHISTVPFVREEGQGGVDGAPNAGRDCEGESVGVFLLRHSLLPQLKVWAPLRVDGEQGEGVFRRHRGCCVEGGGGDTSARITEDQTEGFIGALTGVSGLVFQKCLISPWAQPAFHQLLLRGVFPAASEPLRVLGQSLEGLLAPYGVSLILEQGGLGLTAQPMGEVGRVSVDDFTEDTTKVCVSMCLNMDLLATLLFSLPDWRILWSHDRRFLNFFQLCPLPGTPFRPFSLYPVHFTYDISFWAGSQWDELSFHAVVREASKGTVEQVKRIDTFSHPDLPQTSYCYRLVYHSHTHALSHTQALKLHAHLQTLLATRLHVDIR